MKYATHAANCREGAAGGEGVLCNKKLQIVWGIAVYEGARSSCTFFVAKKTKKWHKRICWHYAKLVTLRYTRYWLQWLR